MISRIYQGRATTLQFVSSEGHLSEPMSIGNRENCPLWRHHAIFQDAVNYYLVALGALADSNSTNRVIADLRIRLEESWELFPKNPRASSLRDSLRRTLKSLPDDATLSDAFEMILLGNEAGTDARSLALSLLLMKCGGESAVQQGGRGYFPRFCDPDCNPTWDFSASALASSTGIKYMADVLHGEPTEAELDRLAAVMDLSWTIKLQPGKFHVGDKAKARIAEAIQHLLKLLEAPSPRLAEALSHLEVDPREVLEANLAGVSSLPDDVAVAANRKAALDLTFATIAFKFFPSQVTRRFLMLGVKAPKNVKKKFPQAPIEDDDFTKLGDDPIKIARGRRGYVFPAFTAEAKWLPEVQGMPIWKEFDIAAFKEALKALNQFHQKTLERQQKLNTAKAKFGYIIGAAETYVATGEDEGGRIPTRIGADKWKIIQGLQAELTENLNVGEWKLSRASLRGFKDIAELWRKHAGADKAVLDDIVKTYQADEKNRRDIGSVQLFLLLADQRYHELWNQEEPTAILNAAVVAYQLEQEIVRYRQPIRLTPAEATESRRLFMFSDLKDKLAKIKFGTNNAGEPYIETAIAAEHDGRISERRVRITYSAPRLKRDELLGGAESRWLQPMTKALCLPLPDAKPGFDSACSLMPEPDDEGRVRHLLNFPVSLETDWLHQSLGKAAVWRNQFNGTRESSLHLHWPGTERDATKANRWWENPKVIQNGFTLLANDLGQRSAGAWSLIRVSCTKRETKRPWHSIGNDGTREWFAEILHTGMHRLPGEDQILIEKGERKVEPFGTKGRPATAEEYAAAIRLAGNLGTDKAENWLGKPGEKSFPQINDCLIRIANRRLSRLGTYHRWSCFDPERKSVATRKKDLLESLKTELAGYDDPEVRRMAEMLESGDIANFTSAAGEAFEKLRDDLELHLTNLANMAAPMRRKLWRWAKRPNSDFGDLIADPAPDHLPKIRWQRGLSMQRLEQLEGLRRLFLRYNRSLDREAKTPAPFGHEDRGRDSGEPCRHLLEKIDRMKEQRVNQTAHLILAQALGLRLRPHADPKAARPDYLHGEYEKIPGREPVDFIVVEDLSRYLSSQGRAPSENSRLMKWSHRAVRDKLKMLAEEPFGIPIVEVVPTYSSRFHAVNGQPGARLHEISALENYQRTSLEKVASNTGKEDATKAGLSAQLLSQFEELENLNAERAKKKPHTLYFPQSGGPLFLAVKDGNPVQADTNAASNLGLRAIAAPEAIHIHRRIRAKHEKEKDIYTARTDNAREKAAFAKKDRIELSGPLSAKFRKSTSPNFFYEPDDLKQEDGKPAFDRAEINGLPIVSGVSLWSLVNAATLRRCVELNESRLAKWRDQIPM